MAHQDVLTQALEQLSRRNRAAFAASCAERLIECYHAFHEQTGAGDYIRLRRLLDTVWEILAQETIDTDQVSGMMHECEQLVPRDPTPSIFAQTAQDAAAAVVYTLECYLNDDHVRAVSAATTVIDGIRGYLLQVNDPSIGPGVVIDRHRHSEPRDDILKEIRRRLLESRTVIRSLYDWVETAPLLVAEYEHERFDLEILRSSEVHAEELEGVGKSQAEW